LALYTDGISEAVDASGEEFGPERLRELLGQEGHFTLPERHAFALAGVRGYASSQLTDDATLVLISIGGDGSTAAAISSEASCAQPQS
jgi:serine phosphatase RsbU (regulator of sigma subunit)